MRIHRLHLQNFRQHEDTELTFGPGLTGIIGPNGSGKTTILEGIAWAMYGNEAARGRRDSIRRRNAPARARVEVEMEFTIGAHEFRIVRTLNGAELFQDRKPGAIAVSHSVVTAKVSRLLGMTRDEFVNTYFTRQKELAVMGQLTPSERAQFLSRVLGYEKLREAQDLLRERRSSLRAGLEALRRGLGDPEVIARDLASARQRTSTAAQRGRETQDALTAAERRLAEVRPRWEAVQRAREAAAALEAERRLAAEQQRAATERRTRTEADLASARTAAARVAELGAKLTSLAALRVEASALAEAAIRAAEEARLTAQREEWQRRRTELARLVAGAPTASMLEEAAASLARLREAMGFTEQEATAVRTQWVQDAQEAKTKRDGLLEQYKDLKIQRDRIADAGTSGICPTCGRPLDDVDSVLALLERQIDEVTQNGTFYKQRMEQLKDAPPDLVALEARAKELERTRQEAVAAHARLESQVAEARRWSGEEAQLAARLAEALLATVSAAQAPYDEARHRQVRQQIGALEPLELEAAQQRGLAERTPLLEQELLVADAARSAAQAQEATAAERLVALDFREADYIALQTADRAASGERQAAEVAAVAAAAEQRAAAEQLSQAEQRAQERERRAAEVQAKERELLLAQELDRAFGDLRTDLNAQLRPDLSDLASSFLRDLTGGRYTDLELDEDYQTTLVDEGEAKTVISSGEEDVANLALRLAISQMIAERAGQPLSLLLLDEIFGSLDDDRRAAVVQLLRSLADRFPQVILITHIESVISDGFDRVIRISYDPRQGVARAEEEPQRGDVAA